MKKVWYIYRNFWDWGVAQNKKDAIERLRSIASEFGYKPEAFDKNVVITNDKISLKLTPIYELKAVLKPLK